MFDASVCITSSHLEWLEWRFCVPNWGNQTNLRRLWSSQDRGQEHLEKNKSSKTLLYERVPILNQSDRWANKFMLWVYVKNVDDVTQNVKLEKSLSKVIHIIYQGIQKEADVYRLKMLPLESPSSPTSAPPSKLSTETGYESLPNWSWAYRERGWIVNISPPFKDTITALRSGTPTLAAAGGRPRGPHRISASAGQSADRQSDRQDRISNTTRSQTSLSGVSVVAKGLAASESRP